MLAKKTIKTVLSKGYSNVDKDNILLTNCGMNALFAAYETIVKHRKTEGRNTVIQLGWLYVDTMEIIERKNYNLASANQHSPKTTTRKLVRK